MTRAAGGEGAARGRRRGRGARRARRAAGNSQAWTGVQGAMDADAVMVFK
jgi:hypothetical protein